MRGQTVSNTQIKGENIAQNGLWKQTWGSMRRGFVGSVAAIGFGSMILVASVVAAADPVQVKPFDGNMAQVAISPTVTVPSVTGNDVKLATASGSVEYYLPYPGMLPDSPFYRVKALRDRIRLWMIFDAEGKAKQELFYADKRINAALFLMDGGKEELAVSTASKAEKYLEQSVNTTLQLLKDGKDVKSTLIRLNKATAKHEELLDMMQAKAHGQMKDMLSEMRGKTQTWQTQIDTALQENK